MDPVTIPEDLSSLDEAGVLTLGDQVRARLRELRASTPLTRSIVDEMTSLRAGLDQVNTRAAAIEDERAALEAAAAEAVDGLDSDTEELAADTESDETVADESVETVADPDTETLAADTTVIDEPVVEEPAAPLVPVSQRDALASIRARQLSTAQGRATVPAPVATPTVRPFGLAAAAQIRLPRGVSIDAGTPFDDVTHLADVVGQLSARNSNQSMTGRSYEYVGHADLFADSAQRLAESDPMLNFSILNKATDPQEAAAALSGRLQTLVASGTLCPPDNPIYDFFRLAVPQAPVEAALPTVPAPRGGIRYIQTPDFRAARAAIGTRTVTQNADPATPDKPCSRAVCPNIAEAYVTAVSECVRWDNLTYRAFPELVANYMADVAVNFASVKECLYLTAIDAASTATNADIPVYGAMRALAYQLRLAASGYRKRQNMPRTATLVWYAPNWLPDLLMADIMNDYANGLDVDSAGLWGNDSVLSTLFANLHISPVWYNDQASCGTNWTGDHMAWRLAQAATGLNQWPSDVVSYLHAPGEFVRLDSGSLDVGLVRDSTLNGSNDMEIFMEQWVGVVHLGLEAIKITHRLCPNGSAPNAVPEFDCIGFAS